MAQNEISTGFSMYSPRRLERVAFGSFAGATIDQFTDPVAQNPSSFLNLTNVLPSITGSFQRRWGLNLLLGTGTHTTPYQRMFTYAAAADTTLSGTVDTRSVIATNGINVDVVANDLATPAFTFTNFPNNGQVWAVTSRDWFYAGNSAQGNGLTTLGPWKINFSDHAVNTNWRWGIFDPPGITVSIGAANEVVMDMSNGPSQPCGVGTGYTSAPTVVFTNAVGDTTGHGAAATAQIQGGSVVSLTLTTQGSSYTIPPLISFTGGGGSGAEGLAVIGIDSTKVGSFQHVISVVLQGSIVLNEGRQYAIALKNSYTGHTGNFIPAQNPIKYFTTAPWIADVADAEDLSFALNQGCNVINVGIKMSFIGGNPDPQWDTVVLMATSDGGDLEHLFEVAQLPLSSFAVSGSSVVVYQRIFQDTLPDTVNINYLTGPTLTTNNLWVDVDTNNNVIGIFENEPPPPTIGKFVVHKGRVFGTDGRSLYFSKSIDEVTTSTGLITSKWEEAWPPTNVLDIAYDLEQITGILSDGEILYIGTTDNIYRLLGDNNSNFSIPGTIFRGVGVQSQDAWTVVFKDNVPAGYMWVTPDNKIMLSDFNTYVEVGKPVYSIVSEFHITHIQSTSFGPYSFTLFSVFTGTDLLWLIYDQKTGGWYQWQRAHAHSVLNPPVPILTYTMPTGIERVYVMVAGAAGSTNDLLYFDQLDNTDAGFSTEAASDIPWSIETSWLNLQDTASTVVLNELEVWSDDTNTNVTIERANTPADFGTPVSVKTGTLVNGPLGTQKFYLAGSNSVGRYHKATFFTNTTTGLSTVLTVLRQFQFEHFAQTRI
jgi:hypothetical protein